jgi:DNA integrity scanning protein DisA with diadenylate cyclase activity
MVFRISAVVVSETEGKVSALPGGRTVREETA